jgi:GDP-4-dehydro-6-deoxy-D-mannose reductase
VAADRLRPHDVPVLVGDPSRLRAATGWEARTPLSHTLRDLLDHWRERMSVAPKPGPS